MAVVFLILQHKNLNRDACKLEKVFWNYPTYNTIIMTAVGKLGVAVTDVDEM